MGLSGGKMHWIFLNLLWWLYEQCYWKFLPIQQNKSFTVTFNFFQLYLTFIIIMIIIIIIVVVK